MTTSQNIIFGEGATTFPRKIEGGEVFSIVGVPVFKTIPAGVSANGTAYDAFESVVIPTNIGELQTTSKTLLGQIRSRVAAISDALSQGEIQGKFVIEKVPAVNPTTGKPTGRFNLKLSAV